MLEVIVFILHDHIEHIREYYLQNLEKPVALIQFANFTNQNLHCHFNLFLSLDGAVVAV